ncbi:hypothetical protein SARC_11050 [Sphaeroforma arctica JP610]|uniref:Uncharacterized protein n=1 Tax=Sphaeroforma arctica JP610 TaxID=667725 RepID=A0A0L0FI38_9EUKA|nr:hypothetical protein SARC_11050 [Sphaeroforma arctica JP610]KNC76449.1 hypothetical protein SARC_11050 [Sphaeroforma arctica JP610]|eukprot:XP_014150351.1 hypothetical protein SARC_11050 [Sphaeroforma arctica JP610]
MSTEAQVSDILEAKKEVSKRCLTILESELVLSEYLEYLKGKVSSCTSSGELSTPIDSNKRTTDQQMASAVELLDHDELDIDQLSPVSKRKRIRFERRQEAIADKDGNTSGSTNDKSAMKANVRRELETWGSPTCLIPKTILVQKGRGRATKTEKQENTGLD